MEFKVIKPEHIFIVRSTIREFFKEKDMRFSGRAINQLNKSVEQLLLKCIERSKANGRKTILSQDCIWKWI